MHVCLNWAHRKTRTTKEVSIWSRRPLNGEREREREKGIYTQIDSECKLNPASIHPMVPTWLISFSLSALRRKKLCSTQLFVHELFTALTLLLISTTLAIVRCAVSVEGGMASIHFCRVMNRVALPTWLPFSAAHQKKQTSPMHRNENTIRRSLSLSVFQADYISVDLSSYLEYASETILSFTLIKPEGGRNAIDFADRLDDKRENIVRHQWDAAIADDFLMVLN